MKWFDLSENTSRLTIDGIHAVTIKKRKEKNLNFPFYFHEKIKIINYLGGFATMRNAKKHAEKRLRDFAFAVEADSVLKNYDGEKILLNIKEMLNEVDLILKGIETGFDVGAFDRIEKIHKEGIEMIEKALNKTTQLNKKL